VIDSIHIHRYTLRSAGALNALSTRDEHHGALIRIGNDGGYGYGCIHPWPELGDCDLDKTLDLLAQGEQTALSAKALACASGDRDARSEGRSLFDGLDVPHSHATLMMNAADFQTAVESGFKIFKVKAGRNFPAEIEFIREQSARFPELLWRLDFNGTQNPESVEEFLSNLGEEIRDRIDFIEDAYLLNTSPWVNALGPYDTPMAVDREIEDAEGAFGVAIIKPAVNEMALILKCAQDENKRVVFTSYMDHPLGQCFAAWEAASAMKMYPDLVDTCGLVTHGLFESNDFTERIGKPEPEFHPPAGTGLGFDDLLGDLPWEKLT